MDDQHPGRTVVVGRLQLYRDLLADGNTSEGCVMLIGDEPIPAANVYGGADGTGGLPDLQDEFELGSGRATYDLRCNLCGLHVVLRQERAVALSRSLLADPRPWRPHVIQGREIGRVADVPLRLLAAIVS